MDEEWGQEVILCVFKLYMCGKSDVKPELHEKLPTNLRGIWDVVLEKDCGIRWVDEVTNK